MQRPSAGQILVEVLIAVALASLFSAGAAFAISSFIFVKAKNRDVQAATELSTALVSNVKTVIDANWLSIAGLTKSSSTHYSVNASTSPFAVMGGEQSSTVAGATFWRWFYVSNVSRDLCGTGNATTSATTTCASGPGNAGVFQDPSTQKVTFVVAKGNATATASEIINYSLYFTRTRNEVFGQTDWAGGEGQEKFATTTDGTVVNAKFASSSPASSTISSGRLTFSSSTAPNLGLKAAYGFEEGSGTTSTDASGNANTATLVNNVTWTTGQYGSGVSFPGNDADYILIPNTAANNISGTAITIEFWANVQSGGITNDYVVINKPWFNGSMSDPYYQYGIEFQGTNRDFVLHFGTPSSGVLQYRIGAGTAYDTWYHVAFTYDGANVKGYINGSLVLTTPETVSITARGNNLLLGIDGGLGQPFRGFLDDVRIYNRALSDSEIVADMNTKVEQTVGTGITSLTSSVFDSFAAPGVTPNWIMWQGSGSTLKATIATSNSVNGPWSFLGPDGTTASSYTLTSPGVIYKLQKHYHANKRYFRYQLLTGSINATVEDVFVGYSP